MFHADENLAAGLFGFCQHDCLIGGNKRRTYIQSATIDCVWCFTAAPSGRDRFELSLDAPLPLLPLLPLLFAALCSCPCVITLLPRSPLSRHTSGCFLLSIFRFPSSPSHPLLVSSRSLRQRCTTCDASGVFFSCRHITRGSPSSKSQ